MSANIKSSTCRGRAKGLYLSHCVGRARLVVAVNAEVLRSLPKFFRELGQSRGFALQLADERLSRVTFDESLECVDF
jgi:hypothetical protein